MNYLELIPNFLAFVASLITVIILMKLSGKLQGGELGKIIRLLTAGIFFAVTLHACVELANLYKLVSIEVLFLIMGSLMTIGSLFFIAAGVTGLKMFKSN